MRIRPAVETDLPAITSIYNEAGVGTTASYDLEPLSLQDQTQWFSGVKAQGFPVFVAVDESDTVSGFAYFGPFKSKAGYRFTVEHTIYLDEKFRGQGVGKLLMEALIDKAEHRKIHVMIACIDSHNEGSIAFHEKFGFVESARFEEVGYKFDQWQSIIYMTLHFPRETA